MKLILSQREAQQAILRHVQTMSPSQEWRLLNEYMICGDLEFGDETERPLVSTPPFAPMGSAEMASVVEMTAQALEPLREASLPESYGGASANVPLPENDPAF